MIQPGEILLLDLPLVDPPHDKFVLVLSVEPAAFFAFINSKISPFYRDRPHLSAAQVIIDAQNHSFLDYDSYVDCANPFIQEEIDLNRIESQLRKDPWRRKSHCSPTVLTLVLLALMECRSVSPRIRNAAHRGLSPLIH